MEIISKERKDLICILCKSGAVDKEKYGELFSRDGVASHYFCLLFASELPQKGKDTDGIKGFLIEDIKKQARIVVYTKKREKFYKCKFCGEKGATIGCCVKQCRALFHFKCGLENGVNYQFNPQFDAFCSVHREKRGYPVIKESQVPDDDQCPMCRETLKEQVEGPAAGAFDGNQLIRGTCCKTTFYHRSCVNKQALNAALHSFKCPCCNSKDFINEAQQQGIYIPNRDASWEMETNAFIDLSFQGQCDMDKCLCESGRAFSDHSTDWQLVNCDHCGGNSSHVKCAGLGGQRSDWICGICRVLKLKRSRAS